MDLGFLHGIIHSRSFAWGSPVCSEIPSVELLLQSEVGSYSLLSASAWKQRVLHWIERGHDARLAVFITGKLCE